MDRHIPWDIDYDDAHFFPPEEYPVSFVEINPISGKEEIVHYSQGHLDDYNFYSTFFDNYI